ncbi:ROK family transcriptional regulator [Halanaerobium salsuginis]|jgi:predicted NBD/HSP70 family sugar kinase|uniref:Sugar kinase of the NBD/HSP70 family, may contain an N-terminal HTH domain n=1 Tax=Halanaerobium salsuginis TaxID=29563 RepID=A0A1I4JD24_9FIRM|nr:ROK family transcriptional regulator [Halanaerobium salsuginis]SFL64469.1 Sugar kinase of the NBD/HSP70 family, may contain an N-terminal HTH domain [Halanaerobium salsuginis]
MNKQRVGNSTFIHNLNQGSIFKIIHRYGPITRKELAENTNYSAATITNHVKTLIEEEYVIETKKGSSNGGRKPVYIKVNPKKGYMLAVNIGVNNCQLFLFDLNFSVISAQNFILDQNQTAQASLLEIKDKIETVLSDQQIKAEKILGLGIAVPALINRAKKRLEFAPNLGWKKLAISEVLAEYFSFPILIENEAKAAVIGEKEFIYPDDDNLVFVSINEGIGCGIILDGKLYTGASGNAGEFGHLIIDSDGPVCHCGNNGCWETMASENYLKNNISKYLAREVSLVEIAQLDFGENNLDQLLKEYAANIGIGLVNIINSLSPEQIIIGGEILKIQEKLLPTIKKIISKRSLQISGDYVKINFTELDGKAAVYGLAALVFNSSIEIIS